MSLGGGTFITQNKVLPGSYINFVSAARASATLSDRGYVTMPLELDWGIDGEVFKVTTSDFVVNSISIFGYKQSSDKLKGLRDLFRNANVLYAYRINSGVAATCAYGTAKCSGIRGNDLKIVISKNINDDTKFDVKTYLETSLVDNQTVTDAAGLVNNDYIVWKTTATLTETAGTPLTGGTNGTVDGTAHQTYLDKIESYSYNAMGVVTTDDTLKTLYASFCKRMRDAAGVKFQVILHNVASDYEGVISLKNSTTDDKWPAAALVYWVTGAAAGCAVNRSNTNKLYDGEFTVDTAYTQAKLETAIKSGEFVLHQVNSDVRVLEDINSLVTYTDDKGVDFSSNQTVRVIDQIANDIALLFSTKYLGFVPNDADGRISLWNDIVKHHEQLQDIRAIEEFSSDDVTVEQGESKKSVAVTDKVTVTNAMAQLYMVVTVE